MSDQFDPYHVWLGIPPEEQPPNHYRLLGVRLFEDNPDVIGNALDQRRSYLRTVSTGKRAQLSQQLLNEVSAAGIALLDIAQKRQYDADLQARLAPALPLVAAEVPADADASPVIPLPEPVVATPLPQLAQPLPARTVKPKRHSSGPLWLALGASAALLIAALGILAAWYAGSFAHQPDEVVVESPKVERPIAPDETVPDNTVPKTPITPGAETRPIVNPGSAREKAWMADGGQRVIRQVAGRWIDFRPDDEFWFEPKASAASGAVGLHDPARKLGLELFDGHLELHTGRQSPAIACQGRWIAVSELPDFARREPKAEPPDPFAWREPPRHALVFDGESALRVVLPAKLRDKPADFTIEAWLCFDPRRPAGQLLSCGNLSLATVPARGGIPQAFARLQLTVGPQTMESASPIQPDHWHHLACVRSGPQVAVYVDGRRSLVADWPQHPIVLDGERLHFGNFRPPSTGGFCGIIRSFRISQGARYSENFRPPLHLEKDADTLALPQFVAARGERLEDAAGRNNVANRGAAPWTPVTEYGELFARLEMGQIDLARTFMASHHTLRGATYRTRDWAETRSSTGPVQVLIPFSPPPQYDITFNVRRQEGEGGLLWGLVIGDRQAVVVLDILPQRGYLTGILTSELAAAKVGPTLVPHDRLLETGRERKVEIQIRLPAADAYQVEILLDGQSVFSHRGPVSELAVPAEISLPCRTAMCWGSLDAGLRFADMTLTPVAGGVLPATGPLASSASPTPSTTPPATSPTRPRPPASRKPVPDEEALKAAVAQAKAIYENDFKAAEKAAQKATLARQILDVGKGTGSDPTARYVLLDLARKVFAQAGEVQEALAAARLIEREYEVPPGELVLGTAELLSDAPLVGEQRTELATSAAQSADEALGDEAFELADKLAALAAQSATRQRDAGVRKDVVQRRSQIVEIVKRWKQVQPSFDKLKESPNDPEANLAVGRFYCLTLEDFDRGLAHLTAGGEPALAEPAKLDIAAKQATPAKQLAAAEAWLLALEGRQITDRDEKLVVQRRAKSLLEQALPKLTGLDVPKTEKLLEGLKEVGQARAIAPSRRRPSDAPAAALVGRVLLPNNSDAGILVTYEHGYPITREDFARLLAAAGNPPSARIELIGTLSLPADQTIAWHHAGGSTNRGVHRLSIDSREVSAVGDDRTKDETQTTRLSRGNHIVRWVLTGGDFGTATLEFLREPRPSDGLDARLMLRADPTALAAARRMSTRGAIHFGTAAE